MQRIESSIRNHPLVTEGIRFESVNDLPTANQRHYDFSKDEES